ncbi:endonuclease [Bacillus sp. 1P10SD]|uniref:endonuclease n=1 Tax=Bacillus sp. 1P10SD TaxID=3132265 RepID=UPI0039A4E2EB
MTKKSKKNLNIMLVVIMLISLVLPSMYSIPVTAATTAKDLFFSEYVEGNSSNKAIEIYNGTGSSVDLKEYVVELYSNGSTTASNPLNFSTVSDSILENGETFVIVNSSAVQALKDKANLIHSVTNFNGDDALVLKHNGIIIDRIGQVGNDPGTAWGTDVKTIDQTLVRKSSVTMGDANPTDAFDPATEWDGLPVDTFTNLGSHTMDGGSTPVETKVANVTSSPTEGAVASGTLVTLETTTLDAKIYYTTDGTEPTETSTLYTAPIEITKDLTIKAIAIKTDLENSDVSTFTYTLLQEKTIAEVRAMDLQSNVQTSGVVTAVLGRAIYFQDATAGIVAYTPTDSTTIKQGDKITVSGKLTEYSTLLEIEANHENIVVSGNEAVPPAELVKAADLQESKEAKLVKLQNVTIGAFSGGNYTATDADGTSFQIRPGNAAWLKTGTTYEEITGVLSAFNGVYQLITRTEADIILDSSMVQAVVATPGAGMVKAGTGVTLATGTAGATIHYTVDGSLPTTDSPVYSQLIVINQETTIKAIAVKDGMKNSLVATFDYLIQDGVVHIYDLQGKSHTSKYNGLNVTDVEGVVTYVDGTSRFFIQDLEGDGDPNTSDGILVFKSSHGLAIGDRVKVTGKVTEYYGEGYAEKSSTDLTISEIEASTITKNGTAPLPAPIKLGVDRIAPPEIIDNDQFAKFDPEEDVIDFWESLEGMYVQVENPKVIALQKDALVWVVPKDYQTNVEPGGLRITATDTNPDRIALDIRNGSTANKSYRAKMGDNFTGPVSGVVNYGYSNFKVMTQESSLPVLNETPIVRAATKIEPAADKLTIATYNVENFSTATPDEKVSKIGDAIVNKMKSPDIIGLNEVQDNNGESNDGVVDGTQSAQKIIDKVKALGGPTYAYTEVAPVNNQDGGAPGGNIRVAFLYNTERVSLTAGAPKGEATQSVGFENGKLTLNPGRIDPTNEAFNSSRKPLAAQFEFQGKSIIVVANHFNSKGGDQPLFGKNQPPVLSSEIQRHKIAAIVNNFVKNIKAKDANANVVLLGDFNDFEFTQTIQIAKGNEMTDMIDFVPENERYNYSYQGNAQVLDQVLVTNNMVANTTIDILHINSGFMEVHGRASDHDPVIIQTQLKAKEVLPPVTPPASTKVYNLKGFKTKKLTVTNVGADITVSSDSVITEGIVLKGSYAKLQGEGLKNTVIIISPTSPDAIIDLSGLEVKEVIIENANISQIRGAENVQKWTIKDGVDVSNIKIANVGGEVLTSPFLLEPVNQEPGNNVDAYYQAAAGKTGADLKVALHNIIKVQTKLTYSQVTEALKKTDEDPNNPNNVILLYTGRSQAKTTFGSGVNDWNREHVWAKSHGDFGTSVGPGTDIHHLRPTDASVNSTRGHLDFDNGGNPQGECTECKYDSDSFEPPNRVKGDIARMLMYMAVRYEGDGGELDLELADKVNTYPTPFHGKQSVLLQWSKMDPPDAFEKHRNDVIQSIQGNRNPFIDHPEWADLIWPAS